MALAISVTLMLLESKKLFSPNLGDQLFFIMLPPADPPLFELYIFNCQICISPKPRGSAVFHYVPPPFLSFTFFTAKSAFLTLQKSYLHKNYSEFNFQLIGTGFKHEPLQTTINDANNALFTNNNFQLNMKRSVYKDVVNQISQYCKILQPGQRSP